MQKEGVVKDNKVEIWNIYWKESSLSAKFIWNDEIKTREQFGTRLVQEYWNKIFALTNGKKTLECGCGSAIQSTYLAQRGYHTTMLDYSISGLKLARKNFDYYNLKGDFILGDTEHIPFKKDAFDIVMNFGMLEHFKDPSYAIFEMVRVLKPRSVFAASIITKRFSCQRVADAFNFMARFFFRLVKLQFKDIVKKSSRNFPFYENSMSWREYKKMMEWAGLMQVKIVGVGLFPILSLPRPLKKFYLRFYQRFSWLETCFDNSSSAFARFWGYGWYANGIKRTD